MSWRTLVVTNQCKLSYKNNYMIVRKEDIEMIHLSEINIIIIDSTQVSITSYLLCELVNRKIKVIFCDEKRNPISELVPYYGSHNTSKKILQQISWKKEVKSLVWTNIVKNKIVNQAKMLNKVGSNMYSKVMEYIKQVEEADVTNREGHAAKVYFNALFGNEFCRNDVNDINAALDYGYSIILTTFSKEIVSKGYITQLGLNHRNEFNFFNLSCDLMEPYRILIDEIVYANKDSLFNNEYKYKLVNVLNRKVKIDGKEHYVSNAIQIYVNSIFNVLEENKVDKILNYEL